MTGDSHDLIEIFRVVRQVLFREYVLCGKYEHALQVAAQRLQDVLPIGKVKHIGLLEVPAGIDELIQDRKELLEALRELYDYADFNDDVLQRSRAAFCWAFELLERLEDAPEPPEEDDP